MVTGLNFSSTLDFIS